MDSKFVAGGGELVIGGNVLLEGGLLSLVMANRPLEFPLKGELELNDGFHHTIYNSIKTQNLQ